MKKVEEIMGKMDCGVSIDAVAHRIDKRETDDEGEVQQQLIVKVNTFRDRTAVNRNRKDKKKAGGVKIKLNFTHKRLSVLREPKEFVKSRNEADFVFADVHCSFGIKAKER